MSELFFLKSRAQRGIHIVYEPESPPQILSCQNRHSAYWRRVLSHRDAKILEDHMDPSLRFGMLEKRYLLSLAYLAIACTKPPIVYSRASTVGAKPALLRAALVTGPMEARQTSRRCSR